MGLLSPKCVPNITALRSSVITKRKASVSIHVCFRLICIIRCIQNKTFFNSCLCLLIFSLLFVLFIQSGDMIVYVGCWVFDQWKIRYWRWDSDDSCLELWNVPFSLGLLSCPQFIDSAFYPCCCIDAFNLLKFLILYSCFWYLFTIIWPACDSILYLNVYWVNWLFDYYDSQTQ